ncbi:TIR domain-containing protein [Alkalibacterium sp. f15]|uniref:TIR domain-containing protein n=1 Tax=Alkalibacterium sp. f15 TaxID=3414029 RepID=UPI003BF7A392
MGVNESGLKRTTSKDGQLQQKLITTRKKRDSLDTNLQRVIKKTKKTNADLQKIERDSKALLKLEIEITKLLGEIEKNTKKMNEYKMKVAKEQDKQFKVLIKSMENTKDDNKKHTRKNNDLSKRLNELSEDIKQSVTKKEIVEYDVFLSHSSLDKEAYVSELSDKLEDKKLKVFEDVKVFKIGGSQTDMMNMGILNSRFVVVFLSPNFIESGWSEYEFKSFLNREINEKKIIILPIWHNVSREEVRDYNPYLVDKFALDTQKYSIYEMVESIHQAVIDSKEDDK